MSEVKKKSRLNKQITMLDGEPVYSGNAKQALDEADQVITALRARVASQDKYIGDLLRDIQQGNARQNDLHMDNTYLLSLLRAHGMQQKAAAESLLSALARFATETVTLTTHEKNTIREAFGEPTAV